MTHCLLGPEFSEVEISRALKLKQILNFKKLTDDELTKKTAQLINQDKIVGWFQGRMEFGPRALGSRSILANPKSEKIKDLINLKIKKRETFRPFGPMVIEEDCEKYFNLKIKSPFMLLAPQVHSHQKAVLPAITHIDGTARVQTVAKNENELLYKLLSEFKKISGVPVLLNTSFNQNNEPVVCTPEQALNSYLETELDALAIGPFLLEKLKT